MNTKYCAKCGTKLVAIEIDHKEYYDPDNGKKLRYFTRVLTCAKSPFWGNHNPYPAGMWDDEIRREYVEFVTEVI